MNTDKRTLKEKFKDFLVGVAAPLVVGGAAIAGNVAKTEKENKDQDPLITDVQPQETSTPTLPLIVPGGQTETIPTFTLGERPKTDLNRKLNSVAKKQTTEEEAYKKFIAHLKLREGCRNKVYPDSLNQPTVGIGHLVCAQDNLKIGDVISDARVNAFLEQDAKSAFNAAKLQAAELGVCDFDFIVALGSVNFQLGNGWNTKHKKTWNLMLEGKYEEAAVEAARSTWNKQTPVRVRDFQDALRTLDAKLNANPPLSLYIAKSTPDLGMS